MSEVKNIYERLLNEQPSDLPHLVKVLEVDKALCKCVRKSVTLTIRADEIIAFFQLMEACAAEYACQDGDNSLDLDNDLSSKLTLAPAVVWISGGSLELLRSYVCNYIDVLRPQLWEAVAKESTVAIQDIQPVLAPF